MRIWNCQLLVRALGRALVRDREQGGGAVVGVVANFWSVCRQSLTEKEQGGQRFKGDEGGSQRCGCLEEQHPRQRTASAKSLRQERAWASVQQGGSCRRRRVRRRRDK